MAAGREKSTGQKGEWMNIKKIDMKDNTLVLLVTGTHAEFVNAVRRTSMNAVPTLAIEDISIYKNNSVLFDEYIASRLGSLPLKLKRPVKKGEKIKLILNAKGPMTIYGKDIDSKNPDVEIVNKETPIVKLKKGQSLKLEMEAIMSTGKEHVKWQPGIIAYNEVPEIKNLVEKPRNAQKIVNSCPKKVLELKAGKIVLKDPYNCNLCGYCEDISAGQIQLSTSQSSFVVRVESAGQKKPKEILTEAADIIKEKATAFQSELSKIKK